MQFHYVIGYNTETKKWFVEMDTEAYFPDGSVWDEEQYEKEFWGWVVPEDGSEAEALDLDLLNTLECIVSTFPIPKEKENAS